MNTLMKRELGNTGVKLTPLGLGCMSFSGTYGTADDTESQLVLNNAMDLGIDLFDTSDFYGLGHNEELICDAIRDRYNEILLGDKFGIALDSEGQPTINGKPEYVRACCERSLARLKTDCIDLYYIHRIDPDTPIEETVSAMSELVKEGKIKYIGLSEATPNTIRRAAKIHTITAVQSEYSLFSRDIETDVLPACREVGASLIAYSPLGRGILTGTLKNDSSGKHRSWIGDRFIGENYQKNLALVEHLESIANKHNASKAQIALAWVLAQGDDIFALFGTRKIENMRENLGALKINLSDDELLELSSLSEQVAGQRYTDWMMEGCQVETPEMS